MFEELAVLVEVFDGVGVVGERAVHEFVELVRQPLLGLFARAISRGDQCGVVQSVLSLFVLLAPLCGGALVLVHVLGLAFVPASVEDRSDRLLTGGMVRGDIEQVTGGMGHQATKLVDQRLTSHPGEECANDVRVDDMREGVASLGEPADVIPLGLAGLLLPTLDVPGVSRADIHPLEISDEDPLEVHPVTDAVVQEEFKPCPNMFPHTDGEILNDEIVIIHPSGSAGEPKIFEPNTGVCLPGVLGDVGGRSEALWERHSPDTPVKGPWSWALRAGPSVI